MKRMSLTSEEVEIIEGLRQQRAIWNQAIDAAIIICAEVDKAHPKGDAILEDFIAAIAKLRKEGAL